MLTVEGIFDGQKVEILETIPFKRKLRVLVTFLEDSMVQMESTTEPDPIKALRGRAKHAYLTEKLLESRREDLTLEDAKWNPRQK
jgi:hypothetical protein